jgi:small subunit ribosomal protein S21
MSESNDQYSPDTKPRPVGDRPHRASARSVEFRPIEVVVQDGNVNRALSMLKRKMAAEGIYKELRKRRFFEKPSEERKRRNREAERRRKKAMRIARERG